MCMGEGEKLHKRENWNQFVKDITNCYNLIEGYLGIQIKRNKDSITLTSLFHFWDSNLKKQSKIWKDYVHTNFNPVFTIVI